jgi:hypothetical protein
VLQKLQGDTASHNDLVDAIDKDGPSEDNIPLAHARAQKNQPAKAKSNKGMLHFVVHIMILFLAHIFENMSNIFPQSWEVQKTPPTGKKVYDFWD